MSFATVYDGFSSADYITVKKIFLSAIKKYSKISVTDILDLGCGTGALTAMLADSGYNVIGVDNDETMLTEAAKKQYENDIRASRIRLVHQDMCLLELGGTVQAVLCTYDVLNYLPTEISLRNAFINVYNHLENGGVFYFDMNREKRFREQYSDNCYVFENEDNMLIWQNETERKQGRYETKFFLTLFSNENGLYKREDYVHKQRSFKYKTVISMLEEIGFAVCAVKADNNKIYYAVAKPQ